MEKTSHLHMIMNPHPCCWALLFLEPTFLTGSRECIIIKPWPAASIESWLTFPVFVEVEKQCSW